MPPSTDDELALLPSPSTEDNDEDAEEQQQQQQETTTSTTTLALLDNKEFEESILQKTRVRRERHEASMARLKTHLGRLEAALQAESKRRVAAVQKLQQTTSQTLQEMQEKLVQQLRLHQEQVDQRLDALEERMERLEDDWQNQVQGLQHDVHSQASKLATQLDHLQTSVQTERQTRDKSQQALEEQIRIVEQHFGDEWKRERQERMESVNALTARLDDQDFTRTNQVQQLEARLRGELQTLQQEMHQETFDRQTQDDETMQLLKRYLQQVQTSLNYVSAGGV